MEKILSSETNPVIYKWVLLNTFKEIPREIIENDLVKAFSIWETYINVVFEKISVEEYNKIVPISTLSRDFYTITIGFYEKNHNCIEDFDDKSGVLAHALFATSKELKDLFIHFDSQENWIFDYDNIINLFVPGSFFINIAIHEIGHVLGLKHNDKLNSIMNTDYKTLISKPSKEDILNVQEIFNKKDNAVISEDESLFMTFIRVYYIEILQFIFVCILIFIGYKRKYFIN